MFCRTLTNRFAVYTYLFFIRKYQPVSFCHRFAVNRIHSRQAGGGEYLYYRRYSDQYYRYIAVVQCFRSEFGAERYCVSNEWFFL